MIDKDTNKKELQRIDWNVVKRIMMKLYNAGKVTKTNLATKCNISYDKLILYLNWLEIMDMVNRSMDQDNKLESIKLSEIGVRFCKNKLFFS